MWGTPRIRSDKDKKEPMAGGGTGCGLAVGVLAILLGANLVYLALGNGSSGVKEEIAAQISRAVGAGLRPTGPPTYVPDQAFMIFTPSTKRDLDFTKRTIMANTGVDKFHMVNGEYNNKYGCVICSNLLDYRIDRFPNGCDPRGCQIGLTLAHYGAWLGIIEKNLPAAWVYEDDVVYHDDFKELWEKIYWPAVPADYEVLWLGFWVDQTDAHYKHPTGYKLSCEYEDDRKNPNATKPWMNTFAWATHAMLVSQAGARRLSRVYSGLLEAATDTKRPLSWKEAKPDHFFKFMVDFVVPEDERYKYLIAAPTVDHPATFGGRKWCRTAPGDKMFALGSLTCQNASKELYVPVKGTGLAYQNLCHQSFSKIEEWKPAQ